MDKRENFFANSPDDLAKATRKEDLYRNDTAYNYSIQVENSPPIHFINELSLLGRSLY